MVQPLANAFNFFLGMLNAMPYAIQAFISLSIALFGLAILIKMLLHLRN